jgi:cell division protein FtsN
MSYKFLGFALVTLLIFQMVNISYTANSYNPKVDYKIVTKGDKFEFENPKFTLRNNFAKVKLQLKESKRLAEVERKLNEERRRLAEEAEILRKKDELKKAEQEKQKKLAEAKSSTNENKSSSTPTKQVTGTKADWLRESGIPESDWTYVDYIVSKESGWNPAAMNPSSGACGLAQALPCRKTGCSNYADPVCALKWQYAYVKSRYGSYAGAYSFWISKHWY